MGSLTVPLVGEIALSVVAGVWFLIWATTRGAALALWIIRQQEKRRKPDYARIAELERELGLGVIEEPEPAPRLPAFRAPIQPGVPFERNGAWFIDKGRWEIGYGSGEEGHRRAIEATQHPL